MSTPANPPASRAREDDLQIGWKLKDNDIPNRVLTITEVLPNGVAAMDAQGRVRLYLRNRIFTDGKRRKSGLSLVAELDRKGGEG